MSLQSNTIEAFHLLELERLPEEWVARLWEHNFCESDSLTSQVSVNNHGWQSVVAVCREWLTACSTAQQQEDDETGGVGFWSTLVDGEVSHKSLLALIFSLLDRKKQTALDVECSVLAAQTYLLLLQMPGSTAFAVLQPILFQKTLNVFYLLSGSGYSGDGDQAERSDRGRGRGKGRGRKRRRRGRAESMEEVELEDSAMMESSVVSQSSESDRRTLISNLASDLLQFTESYSLSDNEAAREQIVQVALHLATQYTTGTVLTADTLTKSDVRSPVEVVAWKILVALSLSQHSQTKKIISEVFLQLLPTILMLSSDGSANTTSTSLPVSLTAPSNNAIVFVCHLVTASGDAVFVPLKGLVQHICTKTPDRAEYRSRVASVVCQLLTLFPDQLYSQLLEWLYRLSRNDKISYRVFSLEVISELLTYPLREPPEGSLSGDEEYRLSYKYLLKTALSRCSDKAPSVRGRALSCIASGATSTRSEVVSALKKCLFSQTATDPLVAGEKDGVESLIIPMVRRRTRDVKVGVRKSALQALEAIIRLDLNRVNNEDVMAVHERCMDPALSVRKQALVSLSSLITDIPHCTVLQELWLDGVLPMVMDKEASAQEKCVSILENIILTNITPLSNHQSQKHKFVWDLLSLVAQEERKDLCRYLHLATDLWSKRGKLTQPLVRAVCSHTAHKPHEKAAWTFLSEMSAHVASLLDVKFILENWKLHSSKVSMETTAPLVQILTVIGNTTSVLRKPALQNIRDEVVALLDTFNLSPVVMQAAINTLSRICGSLTTPDTYQSAIDQWCVPLLKKCEHYFSALIETPDSGSDVRDMDEREGTCYLFATGELCQLSPNHTSPHLSLLIHSLLLATGQTEGEKGSVRSFSQSSQLSGLTTLSLSPSLRAIGYITLGKLCLQNVDLTKKVIPQLVRELHTSTHVATRNNIVVVLCDLVVRYSAKVDPYIPSITMCLKDESLLVRRQTLTLLANLIQEDYIKLKGALFFRFISTLLDEELRVFAEFCLVHLLLARNPNTFFQHLIECVFHFNGYEKHRVYNKFKQTEREKELFYLKGGKHSGQRMKIYTFLLSHMTDPQRFQLTAKLCQEVLGGVVDKAIPLDDSSIPVIQDTLAILTSKEIKLSSLRRNMGEELADEGDHVGAVAAVAQTKIITQIVKKSVIENFIPIVIAAKHLFEKEHSPLLRDLLLCLKEMMQDYRNEINEILVADKQLAEEIQFDLKRVEEEQKKAARAAHTPLAVTPHAQMVSPLLSPCPVGSPAAGVFTPPRLRTPTGITGKPGKTRTTETAKIPRITALKTPLPPIVSPLVVNRLRAPANPPQSEQTPTDKMPKGKPDSDLKKERGGGKGEERGRDEDVTTPAAARARASLVNTSYVPELRTPLFTKTPTIPLQRAVLFSTKKAQTTPRTPYTVKRTQTLREDDTVLHGDIGRVASTPEGLAESISFNVSSVVPPSPIPANTNPDCYLGRRSTRLQGKKLSDAATADIIMLPPNKEPRKLDKWRVKVK